MNKSSLKVLGQIRAADNPVSPGWLQEQLDMPRPTLTRTLARLVSGGYIKKLGHGTYRIAGASSNQRGENTGCLSGKTILLAAQWTGHLMGHFAHAVRQVVTDAGGRLDTFSFDDSSSYDPCRYFESSHFRECDGMILYHYDALSAAFEEKLRQCGKPVVVGAYGRHLPVDSVSWDSGALSERFAASLARAGCRTLVLIKSGNPPGPTRRPGLRDQLRAVSHFAMENHLAFHFIQFDEAKLTLDFSDSELKKIVAAAVHGEKIGIICWRYEFLYAIIGRLAALDVKLNENVHLCAVLDPQKEPPPEATLNALSAYAFAPEFEVGQVAARRMISRLDGSMKSDPPTLSLVESPVVTVIHE